MSRTAVSDPLIPPVASDPPEARADWLETLALSKRDKNSSLQDLVQEIHRSGSTDGLENVETLEEITDAGSEQSQVLAEDTFTEIGDRLTACGSAYRAYPFEVQSQYIRARRGYEKCVYTFLLLLSRFGINAGPPCIDAPDLFERIGAWAAQKYFGGADRGVQSYLFGFPRRVAPKGFSSAVDDLCRQVGEGGGCKDHPTRKDQKDAKLDLAVWRAFGDRRVGKLIAFGQCAAGSDWPSKLSELQPKAFCQKWMNDLPAVPAVRMFLVPFRVEQRKWDHVCIDAGILFDRCRIAALTTDLEPGLRKQCAEWSRYVSKTYL